MAKAVAFDVEARQDLKRGIDIVAQSVRITLGPKGRNATPVQGHEDLGLKLDQTRIEQLGRARRVTVTKDDTTIVEGAGETQAIQARISAPASAAD